MISFPGAADHSMWAQVYLMLTAFHIKCASFCILPQNLLQHCKNLELLTQQMAVVRGDLMHLERNQQPMTSGSLHINAPAFCTASEKI